MSKRPNMSNYNLLRWLIYYTREYMHPCFCFRTGATYVFEEPWEKWMSTTLTFLSSQSYIWLKQVSYILPMHSPLLSRLLVYPTHLCAWGHCTHACVQTLNSTCWMLSATRNHEVCSSLESHTPLSTFVWIKVIQHSLL